MSISCHFGYCKALLFLSVTHVSSATASVLVFDLSTFKCLLLLATRSKPAERLQLICVHVSCNQVTMPLSDVSVPYRLTRSRTSLAVFCKQLIRMQQLCDSCTDCHVVYCCIVKSHWQTWHFFQMTEVHYTIWAKCSWRTRKYFYQNVGT